MKKIIVVIVCILLIILGFMFIKMKNEIKNEEVISEKIELIVRGKPQFILAHGWGYKYSCEVFQVIKGNFEQKSFIMDLNIGDEKELRSKMAKDNIIEMGFKKILNDQPYMQGGTSGFIDKKGVTWNLVFMHLIEK